MKLILGATLGIWLGTLAFPASAFPAPPAGGQLAGRELRIRYAQAAQPDSQPKRQGKPVEAKGAVRASSDGVAVKKGHRRHEVIERRRVTLDPKLDGNLDETRESNRQD